MAVRQITDDGRLLHLLTLDGIPRPVIERLFALADTYGGMREGIPVGAPTLAGKLLVNIFFESSTRTRTAFEIAAKRLGAQVVNLDQTRMASAVKKESLADTVRTVAAMGAAGFVLRHSEDGAAMAAADVAADVDGGIKIINGGDGCNAHPTQGLTDVYTLRREVTTPQKPLEELRIAIIGDVLHSRVARSNLHILREFGVKDIRLSGPPALCPPTLADTLGAPVIADIDEAMANADVVMLLRIQRERAGVSDDIAAREYLKNYGMSEARAAALPPGAVIMHPGPINRGLEIADTVADSERSLIIRQVRHGMAIRMAVLADLIAEGH